MDKVLVQLAAKQLDKQFIEEVNKLINKKPTKIVVSINDEGDVIDKKVVETSLESVLNSALNELKLYGVTEIQLPRNFESIIHSNVELKVLQSENEILDVEMEDFDFNLLEIMKLLKTSYLLETQLDSNHVEDMINAKVKLLIILLDYSISIIKRYFRIDIYGLPTEIFFEVLFTILLDNQFGITQSQFNTEYEFNYNDKENNNHKFITANKMHYDLDIYNILVLKENKYLIRKLQNLVPGICIEDMMVEDGFDSENYLLEKTLNKNKTYYLKIDPYITKSNGISKHFIDEILGSVKNLNDQYNSEVVDYSKNNKRLKLLSTTMAHIDLYFDLRFIQKKSYQEIANIYNIPYIQAYRDINILSKRIGYEKENKELKNIKYIKSY